ncbi:MAG: hypothetical protein Q8R47_01955 [Nanoarchaeota archaeon]|nr:hypothetical protein [Nanoarchaeota archaeon]
MFHKEENNPFKYYDPRGLGCYKDLLVPTGLCIPTTDDGAWEHFPKHRWVYNKLEVALSQNLRCAPVGVEPKEFPVFMKPITNLYGAGLSSGLILSPEEYEKKKHLSGHFWMEFLQGEHLSHDLVVMNGEVVFNLAFRGEKLGQGMFDYWETVESAVSTDYVSSWVKKNLSDYTGTVNLETIDCKIIECHLRMGDIDRLGNSKLMQNIIDIYAGKKWTFQEKLSPCYLFALWGDYNIAYQIDKNIAEEIGKNLTCYQIDNPELYFQNPPGGVRVAITCSYDKEAAFQARYSLYESFSPPPRKPKNKY